MRYKVSFLILITMLVLSQSPFLFLAPEERASSEYYETAGFTKPNIRVDVTPTPSTNTRPSFASSKNGLLFVAYQSNAMSCVVNLTCWDIFVSMSADYGNTWSFPAKVNDVYASAVLPTIAVDDNYVYVAWDDDRRTGEIEELQPHVYVDRSPLSCLNFGVDQRVDYHTPPDYSATNPFIASDGVNVYVAWSDTRNSPPDFSFSDIYFDYSPVSEFNFSHDDIKVSDQQSATTYATSSSIAADGTYVYVAWWDGRDGRHSIYADMSPVSNINFSGPDVKVSDPVVVAPSLSYHLTIGGGYVTDIYGFMRIDEAGKFRTTLYADHAPLGTLDFRENDTIIADYYGFALFASASDDDWVYFAWQGCVRPRTNLICGIYFNKASVESLEVSGIETRVSDEVPFGQVVPGIAVWNDSTQPIVNVVWEDWRIEYWNPERTIMLHHNTNIFFASSPQLWAPPSPKPVSPKNLRASIQGEDILLEWEGASNATYYEIFSGNHPTKIDFSSPLALVDSSQNFWYHRNGLSQGDESYYAIRSVVCPTGERSATTNTVGRFTHHLSKGLNTFSSPLQPFSSFNFSHLLDLSGADYLEWMDSLGDWKRYSKGGEDKPIALGEGYLLYLPEARNITITGMPGAMILYGGYGFVTERDSLTASVSGKDVILQWKNQWKDRYQNPSDFYPLGYAIWRSERRDGFFTGNYVEVARIPPTQVSLVDPQAFSSASELYYIVIPLFNISNSVYYGSSTYSIGLWMMNFTGHEAIGLPLKPLQIHTVDWYCNQIPKALGIVWLEENYQLWIPHFTQMPEGAYDTFLLQGRAYQLTVAGSNVFYPFIGW